MMRAHLLVAVLLVGECRGDQQDDQQPAHLALNASLAATVHKYAHMYNASLVAGVVGSLHGHSFSWTHAAGMDDRGMHGSTPMAMRATSKLPAASQAHIISQNGLQARAEFEM